ncbi:hypothetical protein ACFSKU_14715 [Pontibacter silvestris]|uniref:PH domain-containing protein n=1 Tax=Pontibacter silvestris TaxID=2305183 RepID=A0ABW4X0T6_9BACT|nr:hypothetical protein [Pontibacter silvestris]MCC9138967.1 hypothetical protein [Pontibacter silvestris]
MKLEAFEFKNRWWVFVIAIALQVMLFLSCFYLYATFFDLPNKGAFYLTFLLFLILSSILIRAIAKKYRFISIGQLTLIDDYLLQSKTKIKLPISNSTELKVNYAGDKYWKSSFKPLMLYKQLLRYDHLFGTSGLKESFDYIEANGKRIYIKIKNEADKKAFFELIEKLQQLNPDLEKSIE